MIEKTNLEFEELSFIEEQERVKVNFLKSYSFFLDKQELEKIGSFKIKKNAIIFDVPEKRAVRKFNMLIDEGFRHLENNLTKRKTIYITENSGIPLIGNNSFGIVDRNTSLIEIKPATGCNLNCIYCSVDEGKDGKWQHDFVVDSEYLLQEFEKLVEFKECDVEAHIGTQGEPFLYPKILELIKGLSSIKQVTTISLDTNGTLLTEKLVDELAQAGLTRINMSINSIDPELATKIAGTGYNLAHVLKISEYISQKMELLIAPVWIPTINDDEIPKLIEFAKKLDVRIGVQNFLSYRFGRNPVKEAGWDRFNKWMKELEAKFDAKLLFTEEDFSIKKTKILPKPFKKRHVIKAQIVCDGRKKGDKIAIAQDRTITVPKCNKKGEIKIKITRSKHNVFYGLCLS